MANILLLDESDVASRALHGILARARHACFTVTKPEEAWRRLREGVVFDLVILELKLANNGGMQFLQRLRDDWFWKILPVVVYTSDTDVRQVRKALALKVQNYLIKPYTDHLIYTEVAKALANPWRNLHFEEAKSFCALMELKPEALVAMRRDVMTAYDKAAQLFPAWAERRQNEEVFAQINARASAAEAAGVWAGVDYLRDLLAQAQLGNWSAFASSAEYLEFASRLIFCQLNPSYAPDCLRSPAELAEAREAAERARWERADVDAHGPVLDAAALKKQAAALPGCPVIDTAVAAFQMVADGKATSLSQTIDLLSSDPGLCAQVLAAANKADHDAMTSIEDPASAATLLGEMKLHTLALALPVAHERHMHLPPLTWPAYWTFQMSVARLSRFICTYLEFDYLAGVAQTAGLLHDLGKLVLLKLHPFGLQAIVRYAREKKVPLAHAERKYLGCTTHDLALAFAEAGGLPSRFVEVIRWIEEPEQAAQHGELVAMVALARHLCIENHMGNWMEPPRAPVSFAATAAWRALQPRLFPGFDLKKFEAQVHAQCIAMRQEFGGRVRSEALVA
jgi:HD-like signal output (HDOD) protein/CheY-like chemotaxis protein